MSKYYGAAKKLGYGFLCIAILNILVGILYGRYFLGGFTSLLMIIAGIVLVIYAVILKNGSKE